MSSQTSPLPIINTVIEAAKFTYKNLLYLLIISWLGTLFLLFIEFPFRITSFADYRAGSFVILAANIVILSIIAVPWHQFVLLGKKIDEHWYFKLDSNAVHYMLALVAMALLGFLLIASTGLLAGLLTSMGAPSFLSITPFAVVFVLILWMIARLSIVLPAKAIGSHVVTLKSVWPMTQPHQWPLFAGSFLCYVAATPFYLVGYLTSVIKPAMGVLGDVLDTILGTACAIGGGAISLTFLSLAFRYIYEIPNPDRPSAPQP